MTDSLVTVLQHSRAVVFSAESLGKFSNGRSTYPQVKKMTTDLDVAMWGEDNRFPQNIIHALEKCGIAQAGLNHKAKSLWGAGLIYGKVVDINSDGSEIFQVAKKGDFPEVDQFWKQNNIPRYFAEFNQDYVYFANCFPELMLSQDGKKIAGIVHQESSDCRFKQMNDQGYIDTCFISKLWGMEKDQYVHFDPNKTFAKNYISHPNEVDGIFIKELPVIDMYDALDSLTQLVKEKKTNFILPVNYPSPNKTYYQLAPWDGVRMGGWIDIASRVPEMLAAMYENGYNLKYHIEIPHGYFERKFGSTEWAKMTSEEKKKKYNDVTASMDKFLSGSENAHKTFVSYFDTAEHDGNKEYNRIKISVIENKSNVDKDLITSGTANNEILAGMEINPSVLGVGMSGGIFDNNQGGSNIREGKITADSLLSIDRQIGLEPFRLIKEFNQWPEELEFRYKDTVLTTLDKGKETKTNIK